MRVTTPSGVVEGAEGDGVLLFAGIPYAEPPVGDLRFQPPRPHPGWDGVRDATRFGPASAQSPQRLGAPLPEFPDWSEDCLTLNVFTPGVDGALRPVIVWIHGGAFTVGSGAMSWYDGSSFARRHDLVVVTVNYRLGALGFLSLDEVDGAQPGAGNNGLLDQIAALRWVRDTIAAFGGDPGRVTVAGGSAGAISIDALLGMPEAQGLFHGAILESGAGQPFHTPHVAAQVTALFLEAAGVSGVAELKSLPVEDVLRAQGAVAAQLRTTPGAVRAEDGRPVTSAFSPVVDPAAGPRTTAPGIPILLGTNLDENGLWSVMAPELAEEQLQRRVSRMHRDPDRLLEVYREELPDAAPGDILSRILTDMIFRIPAIRFAEARAASDPDVWMYLFTWPSGAQDGRLGACHLLELPFVFNQLTAAGVTEFAGPHPPQPLADRMHDAWAAFARTGDPATPELPEWGRYDASARTTMEFGADSRPVGDPGAAARRLWLDAR
ncbi:carboxylesterase/lipase family protein [Microbacterium sp. X-17]|uniref:carboxylesterase/lipase family protein n=1 Tax=Microbacterium sp. X-17 TaxID=3144404 RepID=UPI0031F59327